MVQELLCRAELNPEQRDPQDVWLSYGMFDYIVFEVVVRY